MSTQTNASSQPTGQQTGAASAAPATGNAAADNGANNAAATGDAGKGTDAGKPAAAATGAASTPAAGATGEATTADANAGASEKKESDAAKVGAPEKYELALSKDSPLPDARKEEIEKLAREKNWTNEQAQERIQAEEAAIQLDRKIENDELTARRNDWGKQIESDPRFKGEEGKARAEYNKRLIDECASPALKAILAPVEQGGQGLGNYPPLIDLIDKLVEKSGMRESRIATGSAGTTEKSHADILFKDQNA